MSVAVRELDPSSERPRLLELLLRHLEGWQQSPEAKFDWLYRQNPFGPARVWALDGGAEGWSGLSAAFPRRLRTAERTLSAWVLGDFCIDRNQRSLGPALALQKAACAGVDRGEVDLWYDFPSRTMLALYARMGLRPEGEMVRMAYPLRVDHAVEQKIGNPMVAKGVSALGNALLSLRPVERSREAAVARETDFEGEVGAGLENSGGVLLDRSAPYLNWRYRRDPRKPVSLLSVGASAHAAFRVDAEEVAILDVFGARAQEHVKDLIREIAGVARVRSAERVTTTISDRHPWLKSFEEIGFRRRDSSPFVVYARPGAVDAHRPWFLMSGDRDQ